jgi:hypothetical protein
MSAKKKSIIGLVMFIAVMSIALIATEMLRAGQLTPSAPPSPTMKTLDQIPPAWSQKITDGAKRFELVLDGAAVLDKETGLVWTRSPDTVKRTWDDARDQCGILTTGGRRGWRLPTVEEFTSLEDMDVPGYGLKLPAGHPFQNVQECNYWTSNTLISDTTQAWIVCINLASPTVWTKSAAKWYMWPVRGGCGQAYER